MKSEYKLGNVDNQDWTEKLTFSGNYGKWRYTSGDSEAYLEGYFTIEDLKELIKKMEKDLTQ